MYKLKHLWIAVAAAAAVAVAVAAPATAARPQPFGPVPGDLCGVSGSWSGSGLENDIQAGNGNFIATGESTSVFTASASGISVEFHNSGVLNASSTRVDNGDGTYSMLFRVSGTFSVKLVNGPVLFAGGGTSIQADVFDSATDQYLATTFVWAPPTQRPTVGNPCDVLVPALT